MAAGDKATPPPMAWAQRTNKIYLTINLEDCKSPDIKLTETTLTFKGKGGPLGADHEIEIEFFGEINPEESKYEVKQRNIPMELMRKEEGEYWPRLLKTKSKMHWLKTDFDKWKDEDESDDEDPSGMGGMGGMPGMGGMGGMPGMGGMGGMPGGMDLNAMMANMGNFNGGEGLGGEDGEEGDGKEEVDSDDEDLPDLQ